GATAWAGGELNFTQERPPGTWYNRHFSFPETQPTVDVRVGIAPGDWKTVARFDPETTAAIGAGERSLVFSGALDTTHGAVAIVSHDVFDENFRLVAIDRQGKLVASTGRGGYSSGGVYQSRATFPTLKVADIDHFEFQVRDYEWVEISDLPLYPKEKPIDPEAASQDDAVSQAPP